MSGQKNLILFQFLLVAIGSIAIIIAFFKIYKKRTVLWSLGLSVFLVLLIVFTFFTLSKTFNDWSISVDLCQETVDSFSSQNKFLKDFNNLEPILTCLSPKAKENLKS